MGLQVLKCDIIKGKIPNVYRKILDSIYFSKWAVPNRGKAEVDNYLVVSNEHNLDRQSILNILKGSHLQKIISAMKHF